jgi:hypothetical protein
MIGRGCTAAVNKLVQIMGLHIPPQDEAQSRPVVIGEAEQTVCLLFFCVLRLWLQYPCLHIFPSVCFSISVGPYEHHSNLLPWRESFADVVVVREASDGQMDLQHLEELLRLHSNRPLRIGSFSAASNVTGDMLFSLVVGCFHFIGCLFSCWLF